MKYAGILKRLRSLADPANVEGMARFGISRKNTLGVSMPQLRSMAKKLGKDHRLALRLWDSGIHEARILASIVDDPSQVTEKQMERWVRAFDSWDVCDQACMNLLDKTPDAHKKAVEWSRRKEEFVKRAGFALMAALAVHDKKACDRDFTRFLPLIKRGSTDDRNFVRKAVNWALRQIGKRNLHLNAEAIKTAKTVYALDSASARWIASDAIRELSSPAVQKRLRSRR